MIKIISKLGPGLLFAGAAIGVSHLVQSTRAGADFGWGLIWALILVNIFKYPFFQYGPRYAMATGESLLDGYYKVGKVFLITYFILNLATMFTIQTAVTIVTAGLASSLFGVTDNMVIWSLIITIICYGILLLGKYKVLDKMIKVIILILAISTLFSTGVASINAQEVYSFKQIFPTGSGLVFLVAFMGWMPAPLDISIWHSLWTLEKKKNQKITPKESLFDFNVGYFATVILGVCFVSLGALVMYNSGISFSNSGGIFANQLIELYTSNLGDSFYLIISICAFTTMLSTTITCLDASPRTMSRATQLLTNNNKNYYFQWISALAVGTMLIFYFLLSEMGALVELATILSFITAPFYAILNYKLIMSKNMPESHKPSKALRILSIIGILFLTFFALGYILTRFI
ncbi:MAG: Nramp family divalent metal transporter [Cryomorphaceae bacterium]|jgi:Mn2+/Fe2+ NRAMP family transporter|nr:Nramp family divalent metal transporter [Cryomorphaceae bacterium]MBT3503234.1 Nramp family divalent metal transporter [Cryomorphaceae bacterium]MBT3689156.1 Nramp family divalent metal transporter [Cryomorphaceae bacterium]MBT4222382.1 Nramp family divalent metal transporter [Cryomorphaceae bacterium]MBT4294033.1 Nramp family divalent metal transporter [Cryomorphaceae bacterium]|tara:strand:+ start:130 stop:1341 length:1212 start_codon:yes stop_codon:yes gene_type:complete